LKLGVFAKIYTISTILVILFGCPLNGTQDFFFQDGVTLTAAVPGNGYNTVAFSYRKKGGKWISVGTAEKRTVKDSVTKSGFYRTYLLKAGLKAGTEVEVIAVARDTSGKTATSKIMKVKI
jgi:hypothetical protein